MRHLGPIECQIHLFQRYSQMLWILYRRKLIVACRINWCKSQRCYIDWLILINLSPNLSPSHSRDRMVWIEGFLTQLLIWLGNLFDLIRSDTTRTSLYLLNTPAVFHPDRLKVRERSLFGPIIGVRDIIPYERAFSTKFTFTSHFFLLLTYSRVAVSST